MVERLAEQASPFSLTRLLTVGATQVTVFWHFPAKELVVDDPYDPVIAQAVAVQASDLPVNRASWHTASEPPIGIEPMTYSLRAGPVVDGRVRSLPISAGLCPTAQGWRRLVMDGRWHVRGTWLPLWTRPPWPAGRRQESPAWQASCHALGLPRRNVPQDWACASTWCWPPRR
jgi:hypothetical protein